MLEELQYILNIHPQHLECKLDLVMSFLKKYLSETAFDLFEQRYKDELIKTKYYAAITFASMKVLENMEEQK